LHQLDDEPIKKMLRTKPGKTKVSDSKCKLRDYEIMILNNGMGSPPKLKSQGIRALEIK